MGGWFQRLAQALPFLLAVELGRAALRGEGSISLAYLWPVLGYGVLALAGAAAVFAAKMRRN